MAIIIKKETIETWGSGGQKEMEKGPAKAPALEFGFIL